MHTTPGSTASVIIAVALTHPDLVKIFTSPGCCKSIFLASLGLISSISGTADGGVLTAAAGDDMFTGPLVNRRGYFFVGFSSFLSCAGGAKLPRPSVVQNFSV